MQPEPTRNYSFLPDIEQNMLAYWREQDIFKKVVDARADAEPFVFYDGPPFATGLPHFGHVLQMGIKDAVLRYKTMQGFRVPRKIGWDCHGLPVEYQLEKELGISGKRQIEEYGVDKFVEAARGIVLRYTSEWQTTMTRMGRWMELSDPYTTMDNNYIESVWWAFNELNKKSLVYEDYRVGPYCPRCGTVISNFEVNQGYQDDVSDPSVYVALTVTSDNSFAGTKLVIWTTTPWTLPSNVAVAVDEATEYVVVKAENERYIVAKALAAQVFGEAEVVQTVTGHDLIGTTYEPMYPTAQDHNYRVVAGHHVTTDSGTGLVHMAPAFGEDDFIISKKEHLPLVIMVEADGTIKKSSGLPGEGRFFKSADKDIIADLEGRGLLVKFEQIKHTYPFCWRCDTPLLYYPTTSWYVKVTQLKDRLVEENNQIKWNPEHLQQGRFGKWLEGARDWAVSRDRYWGAPIPVWQCRDCKHTETIGSRADLQNKGNFDLEDLHRPYIDSVTWACESCLNGNMVRVPYVFDCWFESGSMPYAQHHYPFSRALADPEQNKNYPAEFIAEALDQTRGWFYTLHVLGVALFDKRAFNAVDVSGLLMAADGRKLSKKLRNYTEPDVLFEQEGVDALRLFLFTATTFGEDYRYSDAAVADVKRRWITPLLNVIKYYHLSVEDIDDASETTEQHAKLDAWIKARVALARSEVFAAMEGDERRSPYDIVRACRTFGPLIEDLSTWYIRLSRGRSDAAFTQTLQEILIKISTTYAAFLPFVMEYMYQEVAVKSEAFPESVHLCTLKPLTDWHNESLLEDMSVVGDVVSLGREARAKAKVPNRQPLATLRVNRQLTSWQQALITQELNVKEVALLDGSTDGLTVDLDSTITEALQAEGTANELRRLIQDLRKQAGLQPSDAAVVVITGPVGDDVVAHVRGQLKNTKLADAGEGNFISEVNHGEWQLQLFHS